MDIFGILSLIGGLALFLYGMDLMGAGLKQLSGGKMEHILEKLTSNRLMAVLLGMGVTAVIQSSSATTVMVVGFVNSGIMKLSQAVGIIMGANVGTTVTSWLLSLTAIDGSSIFVRLLKPSSFSPVLAAVGIIMIMSAKENNRKKNIGNILIGFAILMFGMETMSDAVAPLADNEQFTGILTKFSNPLLGVLAGAILTAAIQSSSASVGILQTLCATGAISFASAVPIIMGQNIGTCVTALLSAVGASKNAKRASMIHLYFNLIGTILFMAVFYAGNAIFHYSFMDNAANAAGIAVIHSLFNISCTLVLLPFANMLVKLAELTIPDKGEKPAAMEDDMSVLDERFLSTPGVAMEICRHAAAQMAEEVQKTVHLSRKLLFVYSEEEIEQVRSMESRIDRYEDALGSYLIKLNSKSLSGEDSRTLSVLLHCLSDFERISDHAASICDSVEEMQKKELSFSSKAKEELSVYADAVCDMTDETVSVFVANDIEGAQKIVPLDMVASSLSEKLRSRHIRRLRKGKCTMELGLLLQEILYSMGRIAEHCSNIALCLIQVGEDGLETHEYTEILMASNTQWFENEVHAAKEKYRLPAQDGDKDKPKNKEAIRLKNNSKNNAGK